MTIARVRTVWAGPQIVGGGISDLYFLGSVGDEQEMVDAVDDFIAVCADVLKTGNTVRVGGEVVNIDESDGSVVSIVTVTQPALRNGGDSGDALPAANQVLVQWLTSGIVNNRRVRGRFFTPGTTETYNNQGTPGGALVTDLLAAMNTLIGLTTPELVVWSRPAPSRPGTLHIVDAGSIWNKYAVLRSRRD